MSMLRRKVGNVTFQVTYNRAWNEYIIKVTEGGKRNEARDYHCEDRSDAFDTLEAMANEEEINRLHGAALN